MTPKRRFLPDNRSQGSGVTKMAMGPRPVGSVGAPVLNSYRSARNRLECVDADLSRAGWARSVEPARTVRSQVSTRIDPSGASIGNRFSNSGNAQPPSAAPPTPIRQPTTQTTHATWGGGGK
jgi:hypothetical protein